MAGLISWQPLSPFGALVDLDLQRELSPEEIAEFHKLFRQHYVLVLRGQDLTAEQQKRAMSYLGPVPIDGVDLTSNDPKVGNQGSIKLAYHSDLAFAPEPDLGASLYAVDLLPDASSTSFASGTLAYAKLPQALKERIRKLKSLQVWPLDQTRRNRASALTDKDPRFEHPLVMHHPATGDPILYLTEMQTDSIIGLSPTESEALIEELFGYLFAPDNILTHRWRVGDLAIWDNLATQHGRQDVSQVGIRTLRRISIARRAFFEQFPQFRPSESGFVDQRQAETVKM